MVHARIVRYRLSLFPFLRLNLSRTLSCQIHLSKPGCEATVVLQAPRSAPPASVLQISQLLRQADFQDVRVCTGIHQTHLQFTPSIKTHYILGAIDEVNQAPFLNNKSTITQDKLMTCIRELRQQGTAYTPAPLLQQIPHLIRYRKGNNTAVWGDVDF